MRASLVSLPLIAACSTVQPATRLAPYDESCRNPQRPCTLSYDFEPSGAAPDPFGQPGQVLLANEDGLVFRWDLRASEPWLHDHVDFAFHAVGRIDKVEALASARCDGHPVVLMASNFMPGHRGRNPLKERVLAIVDTPGNARVLEGLTREIARLAEPEELVKLEGLALSADCRTAYVGIRSRSPVASQGAQGSERFVREVHAFALEVDWGGTVDDARPSGIVQIDGEGCSGQPEGISDVVSLPDGGLVVLTSYEKEITPPRPSSGPIGELSGSLWHRDADGHTQRIACFPGHKPEAVALAPDGRSVRVVMEDDDYGGRPIASFAVTVPLP